MKKLLAVITTAVLLIGALLAVASCGKNGEYGLVYEKKYVYANHVNQGIEEGSKAEGHKYKYYLFHKDGTLKYHEESTETKQTGWDDTNDEPITAKYYVKYDVYYKYTFVDDDRSAVFITFDRFEDNTTDEKGTSISCKEVISYFYYPKERLITVSKNVLCYVNSGYSFYINEDYVKQIPNYNKPTEE